MKDEPHLEIDICKFPDSVIQSIFFSSEFFCGGVWKKGGKGKGTLTSILWDVKRSQSRSTLNARTNDDCDANWLDKEEKSHWSLGIRDDKRLYSKRNQSVL